MYKILIADDEQLMRDALQIMIEEAPGFEVAFSVSNGEDAMELCRKEKPDIVFMDIMMPGTSGIEASRRIYANNPEITIYILSSYNHLDFATGVLRAKVKEYISRSVSCGMTRALLEKYSRSSQPEQLYWNMTLKILKEKDFKQMYYQVPEIVQELYRSCSTNRGQTKTAAEQLGQNIFNHLDRVSARPVDCVEMFPLSEAYLISSAGMEIWLFRVLDYIFQQTSTRRYELLQNVSFYINAHIQEEIGLTQIIENCAVSQGYLSRTFKNCLNVSVTEYPHLRKLMFAKEYFQSADLSIADATFHLDYNESGYFSKVFRKYENITVYQYKKAVGVSSERQRCKGQATVICDYLVTLESVTEGHPDKVCDQISDGILDVYLTKDPNARVAVETMVPPGVIMIAGEVTSSEKVDVEGAARRILQSVGYTDEKKDMDYRTCMVLTDLNAQSADIAEGADGENQPIGTSTNLGVGDQGIMYGYACNETRSYMPLTAELVHKLAKRLADVQYQGLLSWLHPDRKTRVATRYSPEGKPLEITSIIASVQHDDRIKYDHLRDAILDEVIHSVVSSGLISYHTKVRISPTRRSVTGGPTVDVGLTGRKIMVDTYGGIGCHGGGAFSGKDPTKVDQSVVYMARYVAKNIVAAGPAGCCEVSPAYAISLPEPEAVMVNSFGTQRISLNDLNRIVKEEFPFSLLHILEQLQLRRPQLLKAVVCGHPGREDQGFQWEKTDWTESLGRKR